VAHALIRDRMPDRLVIERRQEDHLLKGSLGDMHPCFLWAHEHITMEEHWDVVRANFSGVWCSDEVHDSGRTMLCATAPLHNFTGSFTLAEHHDQTHMDAFLHARKDRGWDVQVAMTDGSPLYKESWQSSWKDVEPQLCLLHGIKEVHKLILDGVRAIKNRLQRQGHKGCKTRPGRPSKKVQQPRQRRQGMSQKEQATFIWEHQELIVRQQEERSDQDKEDRVWMLTIAPELKLFRQCNRPFYRLFEQGIPKPCARSRRTRMVNNPADQANALLATSLKKLSTDKFAPMIVFLGWEHVDCTNNHVERNHRVFRMRQKTRYKRRKDHTMAKALELDLYARMLRHPFYEHNFREQHLPFQEESIQKMAA